MGMIIGPWLQKAAAVGKAIVVGIPVSKVVAMAPAMATIRAIAEVPRKVATCRFQYRSNYLKFTVFR